MNHTRQLGYTMGELLLVVSLATLAAGAASAAWQNYMRNNNVATTARTLKMSVEKARLLAVYRGVNHFVVIDEASRTLSVVEDSSQPLGTYDDGDPTVSSVQWANTVQLALPSNVESLPGPLGTGTVTDAVSLPPSNTGAAWGQTLRGVMATPKGQLKSAEFIPQVLGVGALVFHDQSADRTVALSLAGLSGAVRAHRLVDQHWESM